MPILDYQCDNDHIFESTTKDKVVICPKCSSPSEIIWLSPSSPHRQLQVPIVMWQYPDGSLGVAGGADSKTPPNAERVEIRSAGQYRRYAKQINTQLQTKDSKLEERYLQVKEHMDKQARSRLTYLMGQESDPLAKDIYREALKSKGRVSPQFREFFSAAMENDRGNYDQD